MLRNKQIQRYQLLFRPLQYKIQCSNKVKSRRYSNAFKGTAKEQNNQDIKHWVESSLSEPTPAQHFPQHNPLPNGSDKLNPCTQKIVKQEDFEVNWRTKFTSGNLDVVKLVIQKRQVENTLFSLQDLLVLFSTLQSLGRCFEIHTIYDAYKKDITILKEQCDPKTYISFIKVLLQSEHRLKNYELCEELFSEYIKYPRVHTNFIKIGLLTFLRNYNFQLAKEFYIQVLNNQETFPIDNRCFHSFFKEICKKGDLSMMKFVFNMWLEKCEGEKMLPLNATIFLMHKQFLIFKDTEGLQKLLSNDKIKQTGYEQSLDFELCEFYHDFHTNKDLDFEEIESKIDYMLEILNRDKVDRNDFYLNMLKAFVSTNDFTHLKYIMIKVQDDDSITLNDAYHKVIAHYFVKNGLLKNLIQYFSDVVVPSPNCRLNQTYVEQLWNCALQNYPMLSREYTNEMRILLTNKKYCRDFLWMNYLLKKRLRVVPRDTPYSITTSKEYPKLNYDHLDVRSLISIQQHVANKDEVSARTAILDLVRKGIRPQFSFYYLTLKYCMKRSSVMAKFVDELLRDMYFKIPLKIDILWIKHDVASFLKSLMPSFQMKQTEKEAFLVASAKIRDFEREHKDHLNFQNYIQLISTSLQVRDIKTSLDFLCASRELLNESSKREWYIYYSNALKVYARGIMADEFLKVLEEWCSNKNASLITPSTIRSCKGYAKYFKKHQASKNVNTEKLNEINKMLESLRDRYKDYKFQGLNDMSFMTNFLKNWLAKEQETMKEANSDKRQRLKLNQKKTKPMRKNTNEA